MLRSDPRSTIGLVELNELEDRIDKLRHAYNLFFAGIEHIDPSEKKAGIRRLISKLNEMKLRNPRTRFRFQSLAGRFVSLNQYWTRMMREIEEGRMTREMFRSRIVTPDQPKAFFGKHAPQMESAGGEMDPHAEAAAPQQRDKIKREDIRVKEITEDDLSKINQRRPLQGPEAGGTDAYKDLDKKKPAPAKPSPPKEDPIDRVFKDYVSARKANNEPVDNIRKSTIATQLKKQSEMLKRKYNADDVEFKVVQKGGKVIVRPIVKK